MESADSSKGQLASSVKSLLIVSSHFWPSSGGLESRMGQFSVELVASGYRVVVLTQTFPGRVGNDFHGVEIQSVNSGEFSASIRTAVASGDYYACILVQDPLGGIIWSVEGMKPPPGTRVLIQPIINEDGYARWKDHPNFGTRLAKIFTEVGIPLVMTKSGPDTRYMQSAGIDAVYLPNATTPTPSAGDFRAQHGIAKDQFLILHVANLFWVKNHIGLIDALQDLPPSWKLVMVGNPSGEPDCVQAVRDRLDTRPDILFIPGLLREWVSAAMQAADVVVLASKGEGSPITILEAMSHRKTWLATPECGAANDHLGGFICELSLFRSHLQVLHDHRQWREQLGMISLEHWRQCYAWPVAMRGWIDLIEDGKLSRQFAPDAEIVDRMRQIRGEVTQAVATGQETASLRQPLVTVIITTCDRPDLLEQSLQSVMLQGYTPLEVIVLNDAGASVEAVVARHLDALNITTVVQSHHGGSARARNVGLRLAQGDYIAFLDDGTQYLAEHLNGVIQALASSGRRFAYSRADYGMESRGPQTPELAHINPDSLQEYSREALQVANFIPAPTWCFSRSLFEDAGYFNESIEAWEDWEWLIRASAFTDFLSVPQNTVLIQQRPADEDHLDNEQRHEVRTWLDHVYTIHPAESESVASARANYLTRLLPAHSALAKPVNLDEEAGLDRKMLTAARSGTLDLVHLINAAQGMAEQGRLTVSAALYRTWLDQSNSHLRYAAMYNLGTVLEKAGDKAAARQAYQGALNLNPTFERARISLGTLNHRQ